MLGAGGTIAPAIVRDLAASEEVVALRLLDLDLRRAEAVAIEHGGGKAQAYEADATGNLAEQLGGHRRARQLGRVPDQPGRDGRLPRGRLQLHGPRRPLPRHRGAARALAEVRAAGAAGPARHRLLARQDEPAGEARRAPSSARSRSRSWSRPRAATSTRPTASASPTRCRPCSTRSRCRRWR